MKVCIIGDGLVSLALANMFIKKELKVDILLSKKNNYQDKSRTLGISKSNIDYINNEIPTFTLMKKKLDYSLKRDKKIFDSIFLTDPKIVIKKFIFQVKISKTKYLKMIKNRYISTLLNFTNKQIEVGLNQVKENYKKNLTFRDKLICFIIMK